MINTKPLIPFGIAVLVLSCIGYEYRERIHASRLKAAVVKATELEGEKNAAIEAAQKKDAEKVILQAQAQVQLQAVQKDSKTIADLKIVVERLKSQRPIEIPATPIENAQDGLIQAKDDKITHLEGAVTDLQGALKSCDDEVSSYKEAIKADDARANELAKALANAPKLRPWSIGLIYGKTDTNTTQYGIHGSRSFGPLHLGVVAIPHFVGLEAGISF